MLMSFIAEMLGVCYHISANWAGHLDTFIGIDLSVTESSQYNVGSMIYQSNTCKAGQILGVQILLW